MQNSNWRTPLLDITPKNAGPAKVTARINRQIGKTVTIDIVQGKVLDAYFTDNNGVSLEKQTGDKALTFG